MTQYYKLEKKVDSRANYIITQMGYDARKFHELKQYIEGANFDYRSLVTFTCFPMVPAGQ